MTRVMEQRHLTNGARILDKVLRTHRLLHSHGGIGSSLSLYLHSLRLALEDMPKR
jgi:hypothetical protein